MSDTKPGRVDTTANTKARKSATKANPPPAATKKTVVVHGKAKKIG